MTEEITDLVVLYVDDTESMRLLAQGIGNRYGVKVILSSSGNEGNDIYDSTPGIDGVITDWQMPDGDGEVVTRHIKDDPRKTPVIVYSTKLEKNIYGTFSGDNYHLRPDGVAPKGEPPMGLFRHIFDYFQLFFLLFFYFSPFPILL